MALFEPKQDIILEDEPPEGPLLTALGGGGRSPPDSISAAPQRVSFSESPSISIGELETPHSSGGNKKTKRKKSSKGRLSTSGAAKGVFFTKGVQRKASTQPLGGNTTAETAWGQHVLSQSMGTSLAAMSSSAMMSSSNVGSGNSPPYTHTKEGPEISALTTRNILHINRGVYRIHHSLVLHARKIFAFGGKDATGAFLSSMAVYTLSKNEWRHVDARGKVVPARGNHAALVHKGKMYIYGGHDDNAVFSDFLVCDLDSAMIMWEDVKAVGGCNPGARYGHDLCVCTAAQKMYVVGGMHENTSPNHVFEYSLSRKLWVRIHGPADTYQNQIARTHAVVENGSLHVIGLTGPSTSPLTVYTLNTVSRTWTKTMSLGINPNVMRTRGMELTSPVFLSKTNTWVFYLSHDPENVETGSSAVLTGGRRGTIAPNLAKRMSRGLGGTVTVSPGDSSIGIGVSPGAKLTSTSALTTGMSANDCGVFGLNLTTFTWRAIPLTGCKLPSQLVRYAFDFHVKYPSVCVYDNMVVHGGTTESEYSFAVLLPPSTHAENLCGFKLEKLSTSAKKQSERKPIPIPPAPPNINPSRPRFMVPNVTEYALPPSSFVAKSAPLSYVPYDEEERWELGYYKTQRDWLMNKSEEVKRNERAVKLGAKDSPVIPTDLDTVNTNTPPGFTMSVPRTPPRNDRRESPARRRAEDQQPSSFLVNNNVKAGEESAKPSSPSKGAQGSKDDRATTSPTTKKEEESTTVTTNSTMVRAESDEDLAKRLLNDQDMFVETPQSRRHRLDREEERRTHNRTHARVTKVPRVCRFGSAGVCLHPTLMTAVKVVPSPDKKSGHHRRSHANSPPARYDLVAVETRDDTYDAILLNMQ